MQIKSKLTEKDFINANFVLLYSKLSIKIFTGFILLFLMVSIANSFYFSKDSSSSMLPPLIMLIVFPLMTYLGAKRNYKANKRAGETIEYDFNETNLSIKGESFNSQLSWDKIYKVTQTKNWILIWQTRQVANIISKKDIWEGEISDLKNILDKHKVKNNL